MGGIDSHEVVNRLSLGNKFDEKGDRKPHKDEFLLWCAGCDELGPWRIYAEYRDNVDQDCKDWCTACRKWPSECKCSDGGTPCGLGEDISDRKGLLCCKSCGAIITIRDPSINTKVGKAKGNPHLIMEDLR